MENESPLLEELPWIRRAARRMAPDLAEDLVQETVLLAHRDGPVAAAGPGLRSWLRHAMRNRLFSLRRSSIARERREQVAAPPRSDATEPERQAMRNEIALAVHEAMERLRPDERQLLQRRFFAERSAAAIAVELRLPAATVRTRLRRALHRLRQELDATHGTDRSNLILAAVGVRRADLGTVGENVLSRALLLKGSIAMSKWKVSAAVGTVAVVTILGVYTLHGSDVEASSAASQTDMPATPAAVIEAFKAEPLLARNDIAKMQTARASTRVAPPDDPSSSVRSLASKAPRSPTPAHPLGALTPAQVHDCAVDPIEHGCSFLEPSDEVIEQMARCGIVRYDFPEMFAKADMEPRLESAWLDLVGATPDERAVILDVAVEFRANMFTQLQAIGLELGLPPLEDDVTLLDAVIELSLAVGDDQVAVALAELAKERAGQADPPDTIDELPPAERFVRTFSRIGDGFEDALAQRLGPVRARELRLADDGWPGLRHQGGSSRCRDTARAPG